jgi:hypothetical protein
MSCSLTSSLRNCSPAAALHSTSSLGQSSPRFTKVWILASVIVGRTHAVCGSGMEAASAAISPLGFAMDLMVQRVLTRMRKKSAMRGGSASAWPARAGGWMGAALERGGRKIAGKLWWWK